MVLKDVCYKLYAYVINADLSRIYDKLSDKARKYDRVNHSHSLQAQFNRRLSKGQNYRTPCLGWSEFLVSYVGPCRDNTAPVEDTNITL